MKVFRKAKLFFIIGLVFTFISGCGYTTRGSLDPAYKTIYVKPVVDKIEVTGETQEYSQFRSVPPLLDNSFTSALISRFNMDGNLKPIDKKTSDLVLETSITDYVRGGLRYDEDDDVEEYRLKLYFEYKLFDSEGELIRNGDLVADTEYNFNTESESSAISELLDDAARRLVEHIIEAW